MPDYNRIALKIGRMGFFTDIHNCGAPTRDFPVNLYCEMKQLRFYVACVFGHWEIDYTKDPKITKRTDMRKIRGLRNQTETLKFIQGLIEGRDLVIDSNGYVK